MGRRGGVGIDAGKDAVYATVRFVYMFLFNALRNITHRSKPTKNCLEFHSKPLKQKTIVKKITKI